MPASERHRQKALARKSARRKQRKHALSQSAMPAGRRGQLKAAAKWPLHESLLSRGWDKPGELVQALVAPDLARGGATYSCSIGGKRSSLTTPPLSWGTLCLL